MIKVSAGEGLLKVTSPYNKEFVSFARMRGGKWSDGQKVWMFDPRDEFAVRSVLIDIFGTDDYESCPIVDGFHRYTVMLKYKDIYEREGGYLPVSVIDKPISERMASTIRHNRARGTHNIDLMSNIVAELVEMGKSDAWIARHLGMDVDEILRLKQITGLAALFADKEFSKAWE